jgi:hypothetical protein
MSSQSGATWILDTSRGEPENIHRAVLRKVSLLRRSPMLKTLGLYKSRVSREQ